MKKLFFIVYLVRVCMCGGIKKVHTEEIRGMCMIYLKGYLLFALKGFLTVVFKL